MIRRVICAAFFLAAATIARAETLRIGIGPLPPAIGNPYSGVGLPPGDLWANIYDGLTRLDERGVLNPALALSWQAETPTRWVFKLRPGVTFHDGAPFTAADVVATIAALRGPLLGTLVAAETRDFKDVTSRDPLTVVIETVKPDAVLPLRMNMIAIQSAAQIGKEAAARAPNGTGPYAVTAQGAGRVTLTAAKSWRPGRVERIEVTSIPIAAARVQALESGQVDLVQNVSADDVTGLRAGGFAVVISPQAQVLSIALPALAKGPLQDVRVRRALNLAVDRAAIAAGIFQGTVAAASQGATPGVNGFDPSLQPFPHDPEAAKRLLKEAGYGDGFPLALYLVEGAGAGTDLAFQKAAQDLARIGVRVEVRSLPIGEYTRRYVGATWNGTEAFSMLWNSTPFNDTARALETFSCLRPAPFFCDPAAADLLAASAREMDPVKRTAALRATMARMQELAPAIWLTTGAVITAMTNQVQGYVLRPAGSAYEAITLN